jgi:hypothetical protein
MEHSREDVAEKDADVEERCCVKNPFPSATLELIQMVKQPIVQHQQGEANETRCHSPEQFGSHDCFGSS